MLSSYERSRGFFRDAALLRPNVPPLHLLDSITSEPLAAYWPGGRLRAAHSGPILRVKRDSDAAELDVFSASNGLTNHQAIIDHAGALNAARVVSLYDLTTHGRTLTLGTNGPRPKMGVSGFLVADYDAALTTSLARADALGLTGNPALWIALQIRGPSYNVPLRMGNIGVAMAAITINVTLGQIIAQNPGTTRRTFTVPGGSAGYVGLVFQKPAGGDVNSYALRYNGNDAGFTTTNGTDIPNYQNTEFRLGAYTVSSTPYDGDIGCAIIGTTALTTSERAAIEAWQAYYTI